jgi:hypothetical protein
MERAMGAVGDYIQATLEILGKFSANGIERRSLQSAAVL